MNENLISPSFRAALQDGLLKPLVGRVKNDRTLDLQFRPRAVTVYYRGGNLCDVREKDGQFLFVLNNRYANAKNRMSLAEADSPNSRETAEGELQVFDKNHEVVDWLTRLQLQKLHIDQFLDGNHEREKGCEREFAQLIVRENNLDLPKSDYFVCDTEVVESSARFDAIAVHWPSGKPNQRGTGARRRMALVEVKYGDGALAGSSGMMKHIEDAERVCNDPQLLKRLQNRAVECFNLKHSLQLVTTQRTLRNFTDSETDPVELIFVLGGHDPEATRLAKLLDVIAARPPHPRLVIKFAVATFCGYGLFDEGVISLDAFRRRFDPQIRKPAGGCFNEERLTGPKVELVRSN